MVDGVKWPGVTLAVAPSDRQRCDQPLYVAHSRFHETGVLIGESRGRDPERERLRGRPGSAWSTVGDVCLETSRRLGGMRTLATSSEFVYRIVSWAGDSSFIEDQSCQTIGAGLSILAS